MPACRISSERGLPVTRGPQVRALGFSSHGSSAPQGWMMLLMAEGWVWGLSFAGWEGWGLRKVVLHLHWQIYPCWSSWCWTLL